MRTLRLRELRDHASNVPANFPEPLLLFSDRKGLAPGRLPLESQGKAETFKKRNRPKT